MSRAPVRIIMPPNKVTLIVSGSLGSPLRPILLTTYGTSLVLPFTFPWIPPRICVTILSFSDSGGVPQGTAIKFPSNEESVPTPACIQAADVQAKPASAF